MTPALLLLLASAPVELEVSASCEAVDAVEAQRVFALELRSGPRAERRWVTRVRVECDGLLIRLRVEDPVSRKALERSADFGRVAQGVRSRMLGLTAAELVVTSWTELVIAAPPSVEPAAPAPPAQLREDAAATAAEHLSERPHSRLLAEVVMNLPFGGPLLFWGGGLRWSWERFEVFGLEFDLRLERAHAAFALGEVFVNRATLGVGLHARASLGPFQLRMLSVLRGGPVELVGAPAPGTTARAGSGIGPWLGLALGGAAAIHAGPVWLELGLEAGAPLVGVVGLVAGADTVRVNGFWFGAHVGLGFSP